MLAKLFVYLNSHNLRIIHTKLLESNSLLDPSSEKILFMIYQDTGLIQNFEITYSFSIKI